MDCRDILIRQVDNAGVLIRLGDTWICTDILCAHGYGKYMTADEASDRENCIRQGLRNGRKRA
ncbi:MAG: hypothetical protein ACLTT1_17870 [[Clostridium] scindens]